MGDIFISYRRSETSGHAGRLFDSLAERFGAHRVFMDLRMEPGVDFVEELNAALAAADVLLAVIGRDWADVRGADGSRRIDDSADFIRIEIEAALRRDDVMVIPVLVQGARMPAESELPPALARLARRQAHELSDLRWSYDVDRLADAIRRAVAQRGATQVLPPPARLPRLPVPAAALAGLTLATVPAWLVYDRLLHTLGGDGDAGRLARIAEARAVEWALLAATVALAVALAARDQRPPVGAFFAGAVFGAVAGALGGATDAFMRWQLEEWTATGQTLAAGLAVTGAVLGASRLTGASAGAGLLAGLVSGALAGGIASILPAGYLNQMIPAFVVVAGVALMGLGRAPGPPPPETAEWREPEPARVRARA